MKYQFCIRFKDIDVNSAATKAVLDCNRIFSSHGYKDYTFTVGDNSQKLPYYWLLLKEMLKFLFVIKRNSIVAIQYPLLSINNVFKYFIITVRFKNIKFFCVIHDLESLRTGGKNPTEIKREVENLNFYDTIIVHNSFMAEWLKKHGVTSKMVLLQLFDYLSEDFTPRSTHTPEGNIVFGGNLGKSTFIYSLSALKKRKFNVYGPNFKEKCTASVNNVHWMGEYSPEQIPRELNGSFGLIWDGAHIDVCDEVMGNYLRYNNPHKFSLYIVAGLPVIAPHNSAIGAMIRELNIGVLTKDLHELETLETDMDSYNIMKNNVFKLRKKIIKGEYFSEAIKVIEEGLC